MADSDRVTYDETHPPQADPVNFAYEANAEPLDAVTAKAVDAPSAEELMAATDEGLRILWLYGRQDASRAARQEILRRKQDRPNIQDCTCVFDCADDPATRCSLSGDWHVHPDDGRGLFGPCPIHPDAPGDH